jgi:16S rRNA (cytidine1402-2'-O)-methyltransferase
LNKSNQETDTAGTLYVVATPIGNLEDITLRALRILKEADLIAAEDTRRTLKLLNRYQISKPISSYHDHNKEQKGSYFIEKLTAGYAMALVTDAGTPGISDPGYYLVNLALDAGIRVVPVPGPTAVVTALSVSGLPTDRFVVENFLPRKKGQRCRRLKELAEEERTIVLFESPHRIKRVLEEMLEILGDREAVLARELTKMYEEFYRGQLSDIIARLGDDKIRGEITLVLRGRET